MIHTAEVLIILLQFLLLVTAPLFLIRALVQIFSDRTDVPFVRTPRAMFPAIASALDIQPFDIVYELGSGDGGFLLWCAERYPNAKFTGIERNPLLYRYSEWRKKRSGRHNLSFVYGDIFSEEYAAARKIYCYLLNPVMDRFLPKLERTFHGTLASRAFRFSTKEPEHTVELTSKKGGHGEHLLHIYDFS